MEQLICSLNAIYDPLTTNEHRLVHHNIIEGFKQNPELSILFGLIQTTQPLHICHFGWNIVLDRISYHWNTYNEQQKDTFLSELQKIIEKVRIIRYYNEAW
jgi:hypothetical protein